MKRILFVSILILILLFVTGCPQPQECAKEGEAYSKVYTNEFYESCCEGLKEYESGMSNTISVEDECYPYITMSRNPVGVCLDCGDGICRGSEGPCNCPEDCIGEGKSDYSSVEEFCDGDDYENICSEEFIGLIASYCQENEEVCELLDKINNLCDRCVEEDCALEGEEYSPVFTDEYPSSCCEGLTGNMYGSKSISINDECYPYITMSGNPVGVCLDCGDGICRGSEGPCNCPEDCIGEGKSDYSSVEEFCGSKDYEDVCGYTKEFFEQACEAESFEEQEEACELLDKINEICDPCLLET